MTPRPRRSRASSLVAVAILGIAALLPVSPAAGRVEHDVDELMAVLDGAPSVARQAWMWEHLDLPAIIDRAAGAAVAGGGGPGPARYSFAFDAVGTGRWQIRESPSGTPAATISGALVRSHEFRQMYVRRVRTLLDDASPGTDHGDRDTLATSTGAPLDLPPSATGSRPIEITAVDPGRTGTDGYVAVTNTSTVESIDLSGWLVGRDLTTVVPPGTILLPGATGYLVADDPTFRDARGATRFVIAEYDDRLPADGFLWLATETVSLVDTISCRTSGAEPVAETFIAADATWRFVDSGPVPAEWTAPDFDASSWRRGAAPLGHGDVGEATRVNAAAPTLHFRRTFTVEDPSRVLELVAGVDPELGAVLHLNGVEASPEDLRGRLRQGTNVLAVQVDRPPNAPDGFAFVLELEGIVKTSPQGRAPGEVIARGSTWAYLDTGIAPGGWTAEPFDDSGWRQGPAPLGFGHTDEVTSLAGGPAAAWFRREFTIDDVDVVNQLSIALAADDGAVVHLNGVEMVRDNVPADPESPASGASRRSDAAGRVVRTFVLPVSALRAGRNVLAVEVQAHGEESSDLRFDLSLRAD